MTLLEAGGGAVSATSGEASDLFSKKLIWMSGELKPPFEFQEEVIREFEKPKRIVRMTLQGFKEYSPTSYALSATNELTVNGKIMAGYERKNL